jgi:hypothetical protein
MLIKEGDKVKFLNDVGGGTVTKIVDKDTAMILNDNGFEMPVLIRELLPEPKITVYHTEFTPSPLQKGKKPVEEKPSYTESQDVNFFLAFVPENQNQKTDSDLDVYIINDSNYFVFYNYALLKGDKYESITGQTEPNFKEKIANYKTNQFDDTLNITLQLIWFDKRRYTIKEPFNGHFKVKSTRFFKENAFVENDFFDGSALIIPVIEECAMQKAVENLDKQQIQNTIREKEKTSKPQENESVSINKETIEVDLHLHELLENDSGMSDHDKLEYQMEIFRKELAAAVKENYRRIVFIHGIGKGSLRMKITNELQSKYKHFRFQDASFKEYGYGATMVILRK